MPTRSNVEAVRTKRDWSVSAWSAAAAFGAYFCMYAFRKPYTVATYENEALFGVGYKTSLIAAQTCGYMLSKFVGIKFVSESRPSHRVVQLLGLIAIAEIALLFFAVTPPPYNAVWMFVNGLPLGMVFGLVLAFLEGRRHTEAMVAGLCTSFIVADGVVKSAGAYLLDRGVPENWMPFFTGLAFTAPLAFFAWMLSRIPQPTLDDVAARSERSPMNRAARWEFFRRYALGLSFLVAAYVLVTIARSVRADFAAEIWKSLLGVNAAPAVFGQSEAIVGIVILFASGSIVFVLDNRTAFFAALGMSIVGAVVMLGALLGEQLGVIGPFAFMVFMGLGLYLPYIAVHTTLFERLIAMTRERGNIGFLMYLADSFGYLGFVGVMLVRDRVQVSGDHLDFFRALGWFVAIACMVLLTGCGLAFARPPAARMPAVVAEGGA